MSVASKCPVIPSLGEMCLYPVVQQKLAEGAEVNFSDLPSPLNLEASEMIEKFYERFRNDDGSLDRIEIISGLARDLNSLCDSKIYHFAMKELLKIDPGFLVDIGRFGFYRDEINCILMSMFNNDSHYSSLIDNFIAGNSIPEAKRALSDDFARMFDVMQGIKNSTIDLTTYNFQGPMDIISSMVFFMGREQIITLLRRQDLDQNWIDQIYEGVALNDNHRQLFLDLIQDQEIRHPSNRGGVIQIFQSLAALDKVETIRSFLDGGVLPINGPSREIIREAILRAAPTDSISVVRYLIEEAPQGLRPLLRMSAVIEAAEAGALNVVRYLLEEAPEHLRPNNETILNAVDLAARGGALNVVRYLLEEAPQGLRPNRGAVNIMFEEAVEGGALNVVRYLLEEAPVGLRPNQERVNERCIVAVRAGSLNVVRYLLEEAPQELRVDRNVIGYLIYFAAIENRTNVVKYLFEEWAHEIRDIQMIIRAILRSPRVYIDVKKYLFEEAPINLRPNKATILWLCYNAENPWLVKLLWKTFSLQEKILLHSCRALKASKHFVNHLF